nr:hypothetical protein [Tanacetum cinerariifolium]
SERARAGYASSVCLHHRYVVSVRMLAYLISASKSSKASSFLKRYVCLRNTLATRSRR